MKNVYIVSLIVLLAGCSGVKEHDSAWHWKRVHEYREFVKGEIGKEQFGGYTYHDGQPDILPSLHALRKAAEIDEVDLVFPNVPNSKEVTKYWMTFCNSTEGIIEASANPSYVDFKTIGVQPFRMKVWYKPEAKAKIHELIAGIEALGKAGDLYRDRDAHF